MMSFCSVYHDLCYGKKDGHEGQWNDEVVNNLIIYRNTNLSPKPITGQSRGVVDYYARQGSVLAYIRASGAGHRQLRWRKETAHTVEVLKKTTQHEATEAKRASSSQKKRLRLWTAAHVAWDVKRHKFGDFASASQRVNATSGMVDGLTKGDVDDRRRQRISLRRGEKLVTATIGDGNV